MEFFDTKYFFPDAAEGFDITIGNPPYVRADEPSEGNQKQREAILAESTYETLWEKWDLYVAFIERAYKLLKPKGISTLIVSDAYCHSKYAQKSQEWFLENSRILRLDFLSDLQIFDASVHNVLYFFQRDEHAETNRPERRRHDEQFGQVTLLPTDEQQNLTYRAFFPEGQDTTSFSVPKVTLGEICYISYGLRPNSDDRIAKGEFKAKDLVVDIKDNIHPKPYIQAKHMGKWLPSKVYWLEWGTNRSPAKIARATFENLYEVPEKAMAAKVAGTNNRVAYDSNQLFHSDSVIAFVPWQFLQGVRNRSIKKTARYEDENHMSSYIKRETVEDISLRFTVKYLVAILNSSAIKQFLSNNRRSNVQLYPDDWKKLPIPDISLEEQQPIIDLVDQILDAKHINPEADISALETKVDEMVAELYGVSQTKEGVEK